jgi:hypothetical protein
VAANFEAVHTGHHNIKDDHIHGATTNEFETFLPAICSKRIQPILGEKARNNIDCIFVVVYYKHSSRGC